MLVATRDPLQQPGAGDQSPHRDHGMPGLHPAPRAARAMTMLQLAGSFLAIPVALGSAYSVYQANFSPDTQCQQLRANIITMIDKKIDAATRRMLVRRDVETFEKSCGAFDPDAKAAFVTLLQAEPRTVPPHPVAVVKPAEPVKAAVAKPQPVKVEAANPEPAKPEPMKAEAKTDPLRIEPAKVEAAKPAPVKVEAAKVEAPKAEPAKVEAAKPAPVKIEAAKAEPHPAQPVVAKHVPAPPAEADVIDPATNDARWLDAVRGALVSHEAARETVRTVEPPVLRPALSPAVATPVPAAPAAAPALPPATAVAAPAAGRSADDHPVPPGAIPDAAPLDIAKQANGGPSWVSNIPFVGQMLDK